ncbi:MAG: hypoxanthine phosphoribosyltransferase [Actinobacteria bacterium]|nr:hypoxanthine phosphoribosyltransferase [Actinomycetota bacterium]
MTRRRDQGQGAAATTVDLLRAHGHPIGEVLLHRRAIAARVAELGDEITEALAGAEPVLLAPLKSGAIFLADLSRAISTPHELETVQVAGYDGRGGGARLLKDADRSLAGRHVVVVEDVVDTGLTLAFLARTLRERGLASLAVAALLDRPHRRLVDDLPLRFVGFTAPDELLCGYGLGLDERWRALPDVHVVDADALPAAIDAA